MTAINSFAALHAGERIAIVSHGALIKSALCHIEQRPLSKLWEPPKMHNCAHSIVQFTADAAPRIIQYADEPQG